MNLTIEFTLVELMALEAVLDAFKVMKDHLAIAKNLDDKINSAALKVRYAVVKAETDMQNEIKRSSRMPQS